MRPELRKRIFALQQRAAITNGEALALLVFVGVMAVGGVTAHLQAMRSTVDTSSYAEIDAAVRAGARKQVEGGSGGDERDASMQATAEGAVEAGPPTDRGPARLPPIRLDPNTASSPALQRLPGIGPALAGRIIEYRELHGPFRRPADVTAVRGIGPKTFERLAPYLVVAETPAPPDTAGAYSGAEPGAASSGSSDAPSPDSGLR